jgi:hypothetical protein
MVILKGYYSNGLHVKQFGQRLALILAVLNLQAVLPENKVVVFIVFWKFLNSVRHLVLIVLKVDKLMVPIFYRLKGHKDAGSKCASCGMRACICCLYCLENFIKFINHNAYTVIAMEGYSFCTSAKIVSGLHKDTLSEYSVML